MSGTFAPLHGEFARAVRDADEAVPGLLVGQPERTPQKRFNVYRNNHYFSLVEALMAQFPAVKKLLGKENFAVLAKAYAEAHPPKSPLMMFYGEAFADFISAFPPTVSLGHLAEVARIEYAAREAYHAEDQPVLSFESIAALSPEVQAGVTLQIHAACHIVTSDLPALEVWRAQQGEAATDYDLSAPAQTALITRPGIDVLIEEVPRGSDLVFAALAAGEALGEALESVVEKEPEFPLGPFLAKAFAQGSFSGYQANNN